MQIKYFDYTDLILNKSLDVYQTRMDVISNNIANVNTPGFKRSSVIFESKVKRFLESYNKSLNQGSSIELKQTNSKHISLNKLPAISNDLFNPKLVCEFNSSVRSDGNNVDIEKEMTDAAKNSMLYNSCVSLVSRKYKMISNILKG